ncbi:MAG: hypothetical protein ACYDA2_02470 [Acidimicrobiales bacterium]
MALIVWTVVAELVLFGSVAALRLRQGTTRRRELERFAKAAAEAKRLAHNALIIDASIAELSELVIEESLRELGMDWSVEPI